MQLLGEKPHGVWAEIELEEIIDNGKLRIVMLRYGCFVLSAFGAKCDGADNVVVWCFGHGDN